jgi:hypothetical protein
MPYGDIPGFDFEKLSGTKPYESPLKYSDSVRNFSEFLGGGGQIGRHNLGGAVDYAKSKGFNASAVGDDKIDYGDGRGGIDVIRGDGQVWFNNMPGESQPQFNMDAISKVLQAFRSGGSDDVMNPFQMPAQTPAPSQSPYVASAGHERANGQQPHQPSPQPNINQIIEQALMRAFLGNR